MQDPRKKEELGTIRESRKWMKIRIRERKEVEREGGLIDEQIEE